MVERSGRTRRVMVGLAVAWATTMLIPASASAVDSDLKHAFAFKVPTTNGYSLVAVASNERADGRGQVVLFVNRKDTGYRTEESAIYAFPAQLTATSIRADMGLLGEIDLKVTPSGRKEKLQSGCRGETETVSYEPNYFSGFFGFYGEEGYTDALSEHPREYPEFFTRLVCPGSGGGEVTGASFPGARLKLRARRATSASLFRPTRTAPASRRGSKSRSTKSVARSRLRARS